MTMIIEKMGKDVVSVIRMMISMIMMIMMADVLVDVDVDDCDQ